MAKYDLSNSAKPQTFFYGKVIESKLTAPSAEYIASGGNARTEQWTIVYEPLYPFVYAGENIKRTSQNMPRPGSPVVKGSALEARYTAFKALGFDMPSDDDFPLIVGHIFYLCDESRTFGKFDKRDCWPVRLADDFVAPDAPEVWGDNSDGAVATQDAWEEAGDALVGSEAGKPELRAIMKSGSQSVQGSKEIMELVQKNLLHEELVKRGIIKVDEKTKVISRA